MQHRPKPMERLPCRMQKQISANEAAILAIRRTGAERNRVKPMTQGMTWRSRMKMRVSLLTRHAPEHSLISLPIAEKVQEKPPSALLLCENLPVEVTDDMLAVLFQQCGHFPIGAL